MTDKNQDFKESLENVLKFAKAFLVSVGGKQTAKIEEDNKEILKEVINDAISFDVNEKEIEELKELVNEGVTTFDVNGKEIEKPANFDEERDRLIKEQQLSSADTETAEPSVKKLDSIKKIHEWINEAEKQKDLSVEATKTQANFVEYVSNNKKYITNIISYYKKIVETRDEFIALLKEGNPTLEKQTDFFMKTIHEYEATIEDFISATLPKEIAPVIEDVFGTKYSSGDLYKTYNSGDITKEARERWLKGLLGTFRRNDE